MTSIVVQEKTTKLQRFFEKFVHIYHFSKGHEFFAKSSQSIGGKYWKALYFEYTNSSFVEKKAKEKHLGFLGPVIRAEVGDEIIVYFKNKVNLTDCSISVKEMSLLGK